MSFTKIKQLILQNKKSLLFLVFLVFILFPELSFAVEAKKDDAILEILNSILKLWGMMIWLLTQFVWFFLTPEWSSGSAIWFWDQLKKLWIF